LALCTARLSSDWRFDPLIIDRQHAQLGPAQDDLIALDGKPLKRSGGLAIASAVGQPSQRVYATVTLPRHESEITALRQLLAKTEFTDHLLALDSLHTQHETIHQILWGIESVCHQRLDVSLHEDQSRVRSVSGVAVLGVLSRVSLAEDCRRPQPVRDRTYPVWSGRLQKRPRPMLERLLERCLPP